MQWCSKANLRYAESKLELLQESNHLPERGEGKRQMLRIISSVKNTQISGWECSRGEPHHFLDATCPVSSSGGILIVLLMTLWSLWPNMIECTSWQIFHSFSFIRRNWFCPNTGVTHPGVVTFCQWFFKFNGEKCYIEVFLPFLHGNHTAKAREIVPRATAPTCLIYSGKRL